MNINIQNNCLNLGMDSKDKELDRKTWALINKARKGGLPSLNLKTVTPDSLRQVVKTKEAADTFMYLLEREAKKASKRK